FLIQTLLGLFNPAGYRVMIREFGLVPLAVTHGLRIWQPVTYIFLHGGLWPILLNMLFRWMFGVDLERTWRTDRFYTYFFLTGGSGAGANVGHVTHLGGRLVGYLYLRRGSWFFRARNSVSDWQRRRARRKFEVYMRKHRDEPPSRPDHWVN